MTASPRLALTLVLVLAACAALGYALSGARPVVVAGGGEPPRSDAGAMPEGTSTDASVAHDAAVFGSDARAEPHTRAERGDDGEFTTPPAALDFACRRPDLPIAEEPGCAAGLAYPACRWKLPEEDESGGAYHTWRNTTPEHRWGQPALVALVMAVARDHAYRWPGELVTIGDLDAEGPRHQTHDAGHDVDLYLENALMETNIGGGHYIDTYAGRPLRVVRMLRARVLDFAQNLATCSGGRLRIYYNDPEIITPFLAWFGEQGLVSDVGPAMLEHNRLHRFHFHMTIADGMEPLPVE